jgi:hypothetical protein
MQKRQIVPLKGQGGGASSTGGAGRVARSQETKGATNRDSPSNTVIQPRHLFAQENGEIPTSHSTNGRQPSKFPTPSSANNNKSAETSSPSTYPASPEDFVKTENGVHEGAYSAVVHGQTHHHPAASSEARDAGRRSTDIQENALPTRQESHETASALNVRVVRGMSGKDEQGKPCHVFVLQCRFNGMEWWIERRFRDFLTFDQQLRAMLGVDFVHLMPTFPRRQMSNLLSAALHADFSVDGGANLQERRKQLDEYIAKLAAVAARASDASGPRMDSEGRQVAVMHVFHALYRFTEVVKNTVQKHEKTDADGDEGSEGEEAEVCSEAVRTARAKVKMAREALNDAILKAKADAEMKKNLGKQACALVKFYFAST